MVVARYVERQVPFDHSAEAGLLGSLLIDGDSIYRVMHLVTPADFHRARNGYCYQACLDAVDNREEIDQITVARALQRKGMLEEIGGLPYLGELIAETPTSVNIEYYAAIVADTAGKRRLIDAGNRIASIGYDDERDLQDMTDEAVKTLFAIEQARNNSGLQHISKEYDTLLQQHFDGSDDAEPIPAALPTGYPSLESLLDGMHRSDLLILGARPSLGKTSLALNIAANAAKAGYICGIFTLEMSAHQVAMRLLSSDSGIEIQRLNHGLYTEDEERVLINTIGVLSGLPIYLDQEQEQTIAQIRAKSRRQQMEHGLDLLIVDYMQLIRGGDVKRRDYNRVQEMSEISRSLKALALELDIPVLACSQLSRATEQRNNRRPQLSDLRDSGTIEQDADVVMFLYREDQHVAEEDWQRQYPGQRYPRGEVEVIVSKHRNGPTGSVKFCFRSQLMRFYEIEDEAAGYQAGWEQATS